MHSSRAFVSLLNAGHGRRTLLAKTAAAVAASPLAACLPGGRTPTTPAKGQPVTITYWHNWTELFEQMVIQIANAFMEKNPDIKVEQQSIPADFDDKVLSAIAGGTPPDVVMVFNSNGRLYTWADQGALQPLEDVGGAANVRKLKDWVHPAIWELGTYEGKVYGIAQWEQAYCIYYNKEYFREQGLDPEKGVQTIEDLLNYAERLTKVSDGALVRLGYWDTDLWNWVPVFAGRFMDDANQKVVANEPNTVRALEYLVQLRRRLERFDIAKIDEFRRTFGGGRTPQNPFLVGKLAMNRTGPWDLGTIKNYAPAGFEYGISNLPIPPGVDGLGVRTYGDIPAVPTGATKKEAIFRYISFLTGFGGEQEYANLFITGRQPHVPSSEKAARGPAFQEVIKMYPGYEKFLKQLFEAKYFLFPPKIPNAAQFSTLLGQYVTRALNNETTPRQALDEFTQRAQQELDAVRAAKRR
jgi:multiple sugar transport system substrate-binding protein